LTSGHAHANNESEYRNKVSIHADKENGHRNEISVNAKKDKDHQNEVSIHTAMEDKGHHNEVSIHTENGNLLHVYGHYSYLFVYFYDHCQYWHVY
jgi:hypothetical protein